MVSDASGEFIGTTPAPPSGDRVELTDLEVIQKWSLAVRGASADRGEVIAALRADLAWLEGRRASARSSAESTPRTTPRSAPSTTTRKTTTARKATTRKSTQSGSTRGGTRRR